MFLQSHLESEHQEWNGKISHFSGTHVFLYSLGVLVRLTNFHYIVDYKRKS